MRTTIYGRHIWECDACGETLETDKRRAGIVDRVNNRGRTNPASPLWLKQPEAMT